MPATVEAIEGADGRRVAVSGGAVEAPGIAGTYFLIQGTRRFARPPTKFEQRGRDAGRAIVDLVYVRR